MGSIKIAITGAPGTGKTAIINELEHHGHYCFHEIIRSMTAKAKNGIANTEAVSNPLMFVDDPYAFNLQLLNSRAADYSAAAQMHGPLYFFDRGLPDVIAYMDYFNQSCGHEFITTCQKHRYDAIFILPPWKEIYVSDNERLESFEQAEALHGHLMQAYNKFNYNPIEVPKSTVEDRITFILNKIKTL
ncbi:MAG: ATP-binding protein [Croceitalea sp.]|nr:ATP-binding protein [Croceitalea sp.]